MPSTAGPDFRLHWLLVLSRAEYDRKVCLMLLRFLCSYLNIMDWLAFYRWDCCPGVLRSLAVGSTVLGAINLLELGALGMVVVQNFDRVAVED